MGHWMSLSLTTCRNAWQRSVPTVISGVHLLIVFYRVNTVRIVRLRRSVRSTQGAGRSARPSHPFAAEERGDGRGES